MKRPLGFVALLYGGGLLLGEFFQPSLRLLFVVSLTLAATALACARLRPVLIWLLLVFTGWTNLVWRTAILSPHDLRTLLADAPAEVVARGTLLITPTERVYVRDETETTRTLAELRVQALRRNDNWQPACGRIMVTTRGALAGRFFAGQEVTVAGIIAPPRRPLAEGLFDYRAWLSRQEISYQLDAASPADWELRSSNSVPPLSDRFLAWAQATMGRGLPEADEPLRLLWYMTLGEKAALASEVYQPFVESGTMHIFAISGLHIALLAAILVSLLRVFQFSRAWCGLVVIPLIWFYTGATGWQPSAVRSTIMMSVVIGGWSLQRPSDLLNSLAAAAWIILLWDPQQLFQASFQLSFFVVLSIALLLPPLEAVADRWLEPDPFLPAQLVPRGQRWVRVPLRYLATCLATSLAAWLGSWPLTAYYFHLFSPVTLFANLLIVPLSSAALACNLGSLICGAWFPGATVLFNHSGWFWMWLMMCISRFATELPGAFCYVRSPSLVDFGIYYGALIAVLSGFAFRPGHRRWATAVAAVIAVYYFAQWEIERGIVRLTILPLNGGSAVYVDAPGRRNDLLLDCGNTNAVEFVMKPFLHGQGVNRLRCLALTHGELRQIGGAEPLRALLPVEQIATSTARFRSSAYRQIIGRLEKTPEHRRRLNRDDLINGWTVLHPDQDDRFAQADDAALVLFGNIHGTRILLLSDLGRPGQNALLERAPNLAADIVVSGLPVNSEPLCDALLEAVRPRLIVIADSELPATRRAGAALQERLGRRGIAVLYTRTTGAVTLSMRRGRWEAKSMNGFRISGATEAQR
jgi:competence protein ComEC